MVIDMETIVIGGRNIAVKSVGTVVVGSGAAGFNTVDCLHDLGVTDMVMLTEGVNMGTSRNTGSDKQTYYKLTLSGTDADSVHSMAETYFSGGCMDGDNALAEAAMSAQCFLKLAALGVPFPTSRYGEYVGYKTDHDPFMRATSAGPLTSKLMTEALERSVKARNIEILDGYQVAAILSDADKVHGVLCLNKSDDGELFTLIRCENLVLATGGPAGIYGDTVYPAGQHGAAGIAFEAGAVGQSLTEWQFGLASTSPRWNVSGTYMQVLPRFISTDADGGDEREFLPEYLADAGDMLSRVFLKGYQWPFDVRKAADGSSLIDLLVYAQMLKGRRVFLDYRTNPLGEKFSFDCLHLEAHDYLKKAGAAFGTPFERLMHMNAPAVDFYRSRGVDLETTPLEIALCAQHNNGGLCVDKWWQTNISGLFAVGEAAGSHGVYRPGGSALNSGQVGSTRAARYIAAHSKGVIPELTKVCMDKVAEIVAYAGASDGEEQRKNASKLLKEMQRKMSRVGGAVRDHTAISGYIEKLEEYEEKIKALPKSSNWRALSTVYRLRDTCTAQRVYLSAMEDYLERGGGSRGSALYSKADGDMQIPVAELALNYKLDNGGEIQEIKLTNSGCICNWRKPRPIPQEDSFFENVWRRYREDRNIY